MPRRMVKRLNWSKHDEADQRLGDEEDLRLPARSPGRSGSAATGVRATFASMSRSTMSL